MAPPAGGFGIGIRGTSSSNALTGKQFWREAYCIRVPEGGWEVAEGRRGSRKDKVADSAPPARSTFKQLISSKAVEIAVGAVVVVGAAAFTAAWKLSESYFEKYVVAALEKNPEIIKKLAIQATIEDISSGSGKLSQPIGSVFTKLRQSEAGMISVGRFTLAADEQHVLYVYFPEGYNGKITYKIEGEIIADRRFVLVQSPNGKQGQLRNLHGTIDIPSHIEAVAQPQGHLPITEETSPFLRDLRAFTFQLVDRSGNQPFVYHTADRPAGATATYPAERLKVDISYVAYVTPAIQIK